MDVATQGQSECYFSGTIHIQFVEKRPCTGFTRGVSQAAQ